jgi:UDP-N-acetylmuramoyl-tripeptide--D-alanyl-D-alanine ligase
MYKKKNGIDMPDGINFKLEYSGNTFPIMLPNILGMHNIGQALVAVACAHELGCDLLESINNVSGYRTPPGRLSLIEGINNSIIIDDTYNSSPVALESAIEVLNDIRGKRRIAVLGDMLELGKFTEEEHRQIGKKVCGIVDILIVVGLRAKLIAEEAIDNGFKQKDIYSFD